uniref:Si:dkey-7k24.5 n=1 Tax=Oncorhynchus mykiss TaxID=8022 RepID=A0A8C7T6H7_ONCMY
IFLVGSAEAGFCCTGHDPLCISKGWRADRSYGTCYCDQACTSTLDCKKFDKLYWSAWPGCAEPCRATVRMRSRQVLQEGEPCPHVEEHAGLPALITTGGYGNARKKRGIPFQLTSLTPWCQRSVGPHTRWMQYLKEGLQVCVECQPPALAILSLSPSPLSQWQAVGNPRCHGVWRRVGRLDSCSCPTVHSFLFI